MGELLTVKQLQAKLRISRKTAYDLCRVPGFPTCRIGGKILIPEDQLRLWIAAGGTKRKKQVSPGRRT